MSEQGQRTVPDGAGVEEPLQVLPEVSIRGTVPVQIAGVVSTRPVPAEVGTPARIDVDTTGTSVIGEDPRRARVTIISLDQDMILASQPNGLTASRGATWPANVPYVYTAQSALWIASTAGTTRLTVIPEQWAR